LTKSTIPVLESLGVPEQNIFYDKFTTTGEQGED
jgi:propane monooxygenase reductase subunit